MVLGVHAIRGHRVLIDALLPHGAVVRVKGGVIKRVFWATPPLHVPRDRAAASGQRRRAPRAIEGRAGASGGGRGSRSSRAPSPS